MSFLLKELKNLNCYRRLINNQLLRVSGLGDIPYSSYPSQSFTEIYRAQYRNAIFVSRGGAQIWRLEINENIWNLLLLFKVISSR